MTDTDHHAKITKLAKRRGLYFPSAEAYGSTAGFYTYGPHGAALKRNLESVWRDRFVTREGHMEIDSPIVMPEPIFEASGHLTGFADPLVECGACGETVRADHLIEDTTPIDEGEGYHPDEIVNLTAQYDITCPDCESTLADRPVEEFNLMFETNIGPSSSTPGFLRPETAQGIFVEFPQLTEYARNQLPFGVAQIGRAYRNEINPRRTLVRMREFTQAELEHFVDPNEDEPPIGDVADVCLPLSPVEDQSGDGDRCRNMTVRAAIDEDVIGTKWIAYYLGVAYDWYDRVGVDMDRFRYRQHLSDERAHYASDCWDAEAEVDGNWIEITGFAYRGEYDLRKHAAHSDEAYSVFKQYDEPRRVERPTVDPDMSYLGPEYGDAATEIANALSDLAASDPSAFDDDFVAMSVDDETYTIPVEKTGFRVESVTESGEHVRPHVVEPSFGIDRLVYTILTHTYREDIIDGDERTRLALPAPIAPTDVAVLPMRYDLEDRATRIVETLRRNGFEVAYDDSGSIGRRYRRQDEIGTPYCVTLDERTPEDGTVTVRDRDSTEQVRVPVAELDEVLLVLQEETRGFEEQSV